MKAEKDPKTGKWLIQYRYTDWQGNRKKSTKRGFETKREAEEWLLGFLMTQQADLNMTFEEFLQLYYDDMAPRLREHTMRTKHYIIDDKLLPYFGKKKMNAITAADVRKWQNEMLTKGYSQTYLRTVNNQLTAIFNYASKYYDLHSNPCKKAGSIGKNKAEEMNFWTESEFTQFLKAVSDKPKSRAAFMTLFWTGMRLGELLALTPADIDFQEKKISITKSYQRIDHRDVITPPKTPKSNRVVTAPSFLLDELKSYMDKLYCLESTDRLFSVTKYYIEHEMKRGIKKSGAKKIRVHDLRHSHCALLFELNVPPLQASERLGHERVETTLNIYAHLYPDKQKEVSEKLEHLKNNTEEKETP